MFFMKCLSSQTHLPEEHIAPTILLHQVLLLQFAPRIGASVVVVVVVVCEAASVDRDFVVVVVSLVIVVTGVAWVVVVVLVVVGDVEAAVVDGKGLC